MRPRARHETTARKKRKRRPGVRPRRTGADEMGVAPRQLLALFVAKDLEALIDTVFEVVAGCVACDFVSALYRNAGDGLLKERDSRGREYDAEFMRRYAELTPALPIVLANHGMKLLTTRAHLQARQLRNTAFYQEIMRPQDWRHGVTLCFWGEQPAQLPILVAVAYRRDGKRDFSRREVNRLQQTHPFIDCAVNRVFERDAEKMLHDGIQITARSRALGCAILDRNLVALQVNGVAGQLCAEWLNDRGVSDDLSPRAWRLPPTIAMGCRALHDEWHKLLRAEPSPTDVHFSRRLVHPRVAELTALITMLCPEATGLAEPMFVLELDRSVRGGKPDAANLSGFLLQQMTAAEHAVALALADGLSNQEIADRLGKSVQAVKFLLHRIYVRSGMANRTALVAALRSSQGVE